MQRRVYHPSMLDMRTSILRLLAARPGLAQHEVVSALRTPERTVRRHLKALVQKGALVVTAEGTERRYRLSESAHPVAPPPSLTEAEVESLAVAALAARTLLAPTPLVEALRSATEKLQAAWLTEVFSFEPEDEEALWDFEGATGGQASRMDGQVFRELLWAIRHRNPIIADYYTASRGALSRARRLVPLGFLVRTGAWCVVALDEKQGAIKDFSLPGFRSVQRLEGEEATWPAGFCLHEHVRDRFGAVAGDGVHEVRLLVEAEVVPYFERKEYVRTQQTEEVRADGRAVVSFEVEGLESVCAWVLSWGAKVRVLEPESLARQVAEAHRAAAARYD